MELHWTEELLTWVGKRICVETLRRGRGQQSNICTSQETYGEESQSALWRLQPRLVWLGWTYLPWQICIPNFRQRQNSWPKADTPGREVERGLLHFAGLQAFPAMKTALVEHTPRRLPETHERKGLEF